MDTSDTRTDLETTTVNDRNHPTDDYDTGLEEPTIDGDEPTSARELIEDSLPDSNTVDDGLLATDTEEAAPGEGLTSHGD
ncbi:hypothetical protein CH293_26270 [Rhodococcus sp. 14-2470-1b]|nr:hypothetical protein CH293_26270 [Rhodococcus sp. 14-2470-1b]